MTIKKKISEELTSVTTYLNSEHKFSNTHWTAAIKAALVEIGKENYRVATAGKYLKDWGEWLYDLVWFDTERQCQPDMEWLVKSIPLAVESEWAKGTEIDTDFDKLVQSRADLRLMIFQADHEEEQASTLQRLATRVEKFKYSQLEDNYLFALMTEPISV